RLEMLKILNLSHSHDLTQTPDFSNLPNLEKLVLADCKMLSEISNSIGDLKKILLISLEDCISLRSLPRSIYKLKSLKTLNISGCSMIDRLEDDLEQMDSLTNLIANNTAITRVPFSIMYHTVVPTSYHRFPCTFQVFEVFGWSAAQNFNFLGMQQ
ncbi:TMV resistance protein N-like, partial [Trifolium medium]|nr:TMV resistance protein N-like [Trifolium medium]